MTRKLITALFVTAVAAAPLVAHADWNDLKQQGSQLEQKGQRLEQQGKSLEERGKTLEQKGARAKDAAVRDEKVAEPYAKKAEHAVGLDKQHKTVEHKTTRVEPNGEHTTRTTTTTTDTRRHE